MSSNRNILLVAFACPPIQLPMSPVVARIIAELCISGYETDVIAANSDVWSLPTDDALVPYVIRHARSIVRLGPAAPTNRLRRIVHYLIDSPDCMAPVVPLAVREVLKRSARPYAAVVTVSPFHSVNDVMRIVKVIRPDLPWIAYFGDPWAGNPLERRTTKKLWNAFSERRALETADRIVQTSDIALSELLRRHPSLERRRARVVSHTYDSALYPSRPKSRNRVFTVRFIGTLFDKRTPEPLFRALNLLIAQRPDLISRIRLELIGTVEPQMLRTRSALALRGLMSIASPVSYPASLELMYDADALLLIESSSAKMPFTPSKLSDYMGANTPILGIAPDGTCREVLRRLGAPTASPHDIEGIAHELGSLIERSTEGAPVSWCDQAYRQSFDIRGTGRAFSQVVSEVAV